MTIFAILESEHNSRHSRHKYLLDAQTLVSAMTKSHQVFLQRLRILLEPTLGYERRMIVEDGLIFMAVSRTHAYDGLFGLAIISLIQ